MGNKMMVFFKRDELKNCKTTRYNRAAVIYRFKTDKKKKYIFQWIIFIFILLFRLLMLTIFSLAMTVPQF
ncbi:MAG: hypothetical protein DRI86_09460 [Bacteroidetes bacterium]|nr:MAG: hypothetical protein DRI86_09460 [Bacteroidota bacterium]